MKLTKDDLKSQLNDRKTSLEELSKHQQMDTRTIENMRLSLLAVEVYERSYFILPAYNMTLLMTAWCKFKFTMLCKHVIVYYG
jgi:hypothetical protein